jgi:hypothetical protein
LKCSVAVVDLRSGQVTALVEFLTAVEEIFDVQLLPGLRFPEVIGFQQETIQHTFVVPPVRRAPGEAVALSFRDSVSQTPSLDAAIVASVPRAPLRRSLCARRSDDTDARREAL